MEISPNNQESTREAQMYKNSVGIGKAQDEMQLKKFLLPPHPSKKKKEERKRSYLWSKGWMVVPWLGVDRIMLKDDRENSPHLPLSSLSSRMTLKLERVEQTWLRGNWNLRWVNWQYKAALKAFKLRWITSKGAGRNCRCGHRDAVLNSEGSGRMREPHDICFYKGKKLSSHSLTLLPG